MGSLPPCLLVAFLFLLLRVFCVYHRLVSSLSCTKGVLTEYYLLEVSAQYLCADGSGQDIVTQCNL